MCIDLFINAHSGTDPGKVRQTNEDSAYAFVRPPEMGTALALLVVADGMGGYKAGDVASRIAIRTIHDTLSWYLESDEREQTQSPPPLDLSADTLRDLKVATLRQRLLYAVSEANSAIHQYSKDHPREAGNLGCTVTCALVEGNIAVIANVGDSRTYYMNTSFLQQITNDHSYVATMINQGKLAPEEIYDHPHRHIVTRSLGHYQDVDIDTYAKLLAPGDRIMLCSDGLWEMVRDEQEIAAALTRSPQEAVYHLIEMANSYGGEDNIGVAVMALQQA